MYLHEKIIPGLLTLLIGAAIGVFILLTLIMRSGYLSKFDHSLLEWFHKIKNPVLAHIFTTVTWLGSLWVLLPLYIVLILTLSPHYESVEMILGIGLWGTVFTTYVLKFALGRKRPYSFSTLYELPIDPSYPSAHTAQAVLFALLVWVIVYSGVSLLNTLLTVLLFLAAIGVAASRMYLQVHFPTDILSGGLIGFIWACTALFVVKSGVLV